MKNDRENLGTKFLLQWILANGLWWLVGFLSTFILSYFVVNLFYDKETNLIAGLCVGGSIGFAQWFTLKKYFGISRKWILISTLCFGIPVMLVEFMPDLWVLYTDFFGDQKILSNLIPGLLLGSMVGYLQMPLLRPFFKGASVWIIGSALGWGICAVFRMLPMPYATFVVFFGGVLLGGITGVFLMRMRRV